MEIVFLVPCSRLFFEIMMMLVVVMSCHSFALSTLTVFKILE